MTGTLTDINSSYTVELIRKAIHLSSLTFVIVYFYATRSFALTLIVPLTIIVMTLDIARYYHRPLEEWFYKIFGWLLRRHESDKKKKRLNGASYMLISATLCVFIFPKMIALTSFIILIVSDTTSALIGRRFGKHRFFGKSLEGSAAFLSSAMLVILLTPKVEYVAGEYIIGIASACVGTVAEALPWEIDDNLSVPLAVGAAMWIAYIFFYPSLDIYRFG